MINPNSLMGKAFQRTGNLLKPSSVDRYQKSVRSNYIDLTSRSSISESPSYSKEGPVRHRSQYHRHGNTFINTVASTGVALQGGEPMNAQIWMVHAFDIDTTTADLTWTVRRWDVVDGRLLNNGPTDTGYLDHGRYGKSTVECVTGNCVQTTSNHCIPGLSGLDC